MKKYYKPNIEIITVSTVQMIAESIAIDRSTSVAASSAEGRGGGSFWDDED